MVLCGWGEVGGGGGEAGGRRGEEVLQDNLTTVS